jgi:hypothetical protein
MIESEGFFHIVPKLIELLLANLVLLVRSLDISAFIFFRTTGNHTNVLFVALLYLLHIDILEKATSQLVIQLEFIELLNYLIDSCCTSQPIKQTFVLLAVNDFVAGRIKQRFHLSNQPLPNF